MEHAQSHTFHEASNCCLLFEIFYGIQLYALDAGWFITYFSFCLWLVLSLWNLSFCLPVTLHVVVTQLIASYFGWNLLQPSFELSRELLIWTTFFSIFVWNWCWQVHWICTLIHLWSIAATSNGNSLFFRYVDRIANAKWEVKELGLEHNGYAWDYPLSIFCKCSFCFQVCLLYDL